MNKSYGEKETSPEPLVTVLMAVYNGGEYLKTSVKSVLDQTVENFEFLIVNDCSTDDSVKIIESFNDNRIKIYRNEKNMGQTKSLNVGLRLAKGKYVARMDADDMAFPMWLKKLVSFITEHPQYDVVGPGAVVIDADSEIKNLIISPNKKESIILSIFHDTPLNHVGSIMNKDNIIRLGAYNESFSIKQDYELWSFLIRKGRKITSIPELLVAVRVHEKSLTSVESDNRGIKEFTQTVYENIKCLTNLSIAYNDVFNLARLRLKPHSLNSNEFYQAIETFVMIYNNLNYYIDKKELAKHIRSQGVKVFCKRALEEIASYQIQQGRKTSQDCLVKFGFHIMPFAIYLSSFLGERVVHWIGEVYKKILQLRAMCMLYTHNRSFRKVIKFKE